MIQILLKFSALYLAVLVLGNCPANSGLNNAVIDHVEPIISTVTGDACILLEQDIFKAPNKEVVGECDLRSSPQQFDGKVVRLRSNYGFMVHGPYLSDDTTCVGPSNSIHEAVAVHFKSKAEFDYIDNLAVLPIELTAVGRFTIVDPPRSSDTILDNSPYRFELICLERAESVSAPGLYRP